MNWEHKHKSLSSIWIPVQLCVLVLALLLATSLHAAFEGFGSSTPGGNNGSQVTVTSLADSGPGTLREALAGNNRRIVFAVAGTITLSTDLSVRDRSFITIDGSTAPSPGITLQGWGIDIRNSHDVVITHMRIRNASGDGISIRIGSHNVVIDHCSVTNSFDGNIDITEDSRDVTVSWSIIGDTRPDWFSLKTKGMLIANFNYPPVTNISLHHNLFINEFQRSPQVSTAGLFDIRNNVIWNWGSYGIRIREGAWGNIVNNAFDTNNNAEDAVVLDSDAGPVYIHGNQGPGSRNVNSLTTAAAPFNVASVTTDAVTDVEQIVIQGVGALPRDQIDTFLAGPAANPNQPPAATNQPPAINAGLDLTLTLPASASLNATVTDDGLPNPPSTVTTTWMKVSGPGTVTFANPSAVDTTASFSQSGTYVLQLTASDGALTSSDSATITVNPAATEAIRVNAGGAAFTDSTGTQWNADKAYSSESWGYVGGRTFKTSDGIANTLDDPLYRSERYGNFSYRFDVPNGRYNVTLHFAEIYHKNSGQRIFDVLIEGVLVLDNYDIYQVAGHDRATSRAFTGVQVQDGQLTIDFVTVKDNAKVSAIQVQRSGN